MQRYGWLFDRRFEPLRTQYVAFLAADGDDAKVPIVAYEEFPDIAPGVPDELRQRSPEAVNHAFAQRWASGERWGDDGRQPLPVAGFTLDGLGADPGLRPFGPDPALVHRLNDKTVQYPLFRDAGLPVPEFQVLDAVTMLAAGSRMLAGGALVVQPAYSAGGEQVTHIRDVAELECYLSGPGRGCEAFVAARFVPGCQTISGNGLITRNGRVVPFGVTDLLLDGFRFDGFVFPSFASPRLAEAIVGLTLAVGELLRRSGYWGFFTADVIRPADGRLLLTEANVRFSGEAAFLAVASSQNVFAVLDGRERPRELSVDARDGRIVVTKIRPAAGRVVASFEGGDEESFALGVVDEFRSCYLSRPARVISGHFVGLAGRRLRAAATYTEALAFYRKARDPEYLDCADCH